MKKRRSELLWLMISFFLFSGGLFWSNSAMAFSHKPGQWAAQQRIPDVGPGTVKPVLMADRNRTVHVLFSQWIDDGSSQPVKAIFYDQWSSDRGWGGAIDVILPPLKQEARLLDAFLDESGIIHATFFSGDETEASIYYSNAPALGADHAAAWSEPKLVGERAAIPESGALAGDDEGNMVIVFSGNEQGHGLYAVYSADGGETWTDPIGIYYTFDIELWPFGLSFFLSESGLLHAVWNIDNTAGQGRKIYYANSRIGERIWSDPIELVSVDSALGTKFPAVIEHDGQVIVAYYNGSTNNGRNFVYSNDEGHTWSQPVTPFPQVGTNGTHSFAVDSSNELHFFWGGRISGSPDIHGMWHVIWEGHGWSEPEAVVSGPRIVDVSGDNGFDPSSANAVVGKGTGDKGFDPSSANAVVSQGNHILLVWETDPGAGLNGIWYSELTLDSPELPIMELKAPSIDVVGTLSVEPMATVIVEPTPVTSSVIGIDESDGIEASIDNSAPYLVGFAIPLLLAAGIVSYRFVFKKAS